LLALAVTLLALGALGGGWLWLRDSSLVAVENVEVIGARGPQARAIRVALNEAAQRMSTLHVNVGALRAAVAPLRVVRDLRVSAGFPHTLRIRVIERPPVAALAAGGVRTAAAADGTVLGPALLSTRLPLVQGAGGESLGGQVKSPATLEALAVLGAAPPALVGWVARVFTGSEGLTAAMRNGLELYFGDATRAHAKWLAAARVLADPSSQGAWYVDVRLPGRPAVGLPGGVSANSESMTAAPGQVSASDPTAASLAASLAEAVNGSAGSGSATSTPTTPAAASAPATSVTPTSAAPASATPASATPASATPAAPAAPEEREVSSSTEG
jgi:cell division protein FtsQ